jgi:hypothetical protein
MGCAEIRALIRPDRGSMRISRPSAPFGVTHTDPNPTAMFQGSTGNRVGFPTTRFDFGSMRQTAGVGSRVSAHTDPSPVVTEKGGSGKRIRATITPSVSGDVVGPLVELACSDDALDQQPDVATAMPRAAAAMSPTEIGRELLLIPRLVPKDLFGSIGQREGAAGTLRGPIPAASILRGGILVPPRAGSSRVAQANGPTESE